MRCRRRVLDFERAMPRTIGERTLVRSAGVSIHDPAQSSRRNIGHRWLVFVGDLVEKPHKVASPDIVDLARSQPRIAAL
jgi:hypothetical protein